MRKKGSVNIHFIDFCFPPLLIRYGNIICITNNIDVATWYMYFCNSAMGLEYPCGILDFI